MVSHNYISGTNERLFLKFCVLIYFWTVAKLITVNIKTFKIFFGLKISAVWSRRVIFIIIRLVCFCWAGRVSLICLVCTSPCNISIIQVNVNTNNITLVRNLPTNYFALYSKSIFFRNFTLNMLFKVNKSVYSASRTYRFCWQHAIIVVWKTWSNA